jgi:DNA replication protein DnaC
VLERASKEERTYAEFLCDLLEVEVHARAVEVHARADRNLQTRMKLARLPFSRTLDSFDFAFQPSIDERYAIYFSAHPAREKPISLWRWRSKR